MNTIIIYNNSFNNNVTKLELNFKVKIEIK